MGARESIARLLAGKVGGPHPGGIAVYHSSPHDFDKFDWSKLRTGEGANMYGAGFYFAENPKVSGRGGEYWNQFNARLPPDQQKAAELLSYNAFDRDAAIAKIRTGLANSKAELEAGKYHYPMSETPYVPIPHDQLGTFRRSIEGRERALQVLESGQHVGPRTYEVNINARPELMLDWDKPMSQQSKAVQDFSAAHNLQYAVPDPLGQGVYERLGMKLRDRTMASDAMREAGIPGIRYLDQGSRFSQALYNDNPIANEARKFIKQAGGDTEKAGKLFYESNPVTNWAALERDEIRRLIQMGGNQPSYNYVVTDPSKLDILAKYGVVGGAALPAFGEFAAQDKYGAQQ